MCVRSGNFGYVSQEITIREQFLVYGVRYLIIIIINIIMHYVNNFE